MPDEPSATNAVIAFGRPGKRFAAMPIVGRALMRAGSDRLIPSWPRPRRLLPDAELNGPTDPPFQLVQIGKSPYAFWDDDDVPTVSITAAAAKCGDRSSVMSRIPTSQWLYAFVFSADKKAETMITIEIIHRTYDTEQKQFVDEPEARLELREQELVLVSGDEVWDELTETVLPHPDTDDEDLTFEHDPELWARTLPMAFRTGDLKVVVVDHDEDLLEADDDDGSDDDHVTRRLGHRRVALAGAGLLVAAGAGSARLRHVLDRR